MIIGIAGPIASGKSTLARALASKFSFELLGFGEFVRNQAQARGLDAADRRVLQDLGQLLVSEDAEQFVRGVLGRAKNQPADRVILDGIRHHSVWNAVVAFASSRGSIARLIFLEVPESDRQRRLVGRGASFERVNLDDLHASEADVHSGLAERADLRVDALNERDAMLAYIGSRLGLN